MSLRDCSLLASWKAVIWCELRSCDQSWPGLVFEIFVLTCQQLYSSILPSSSFFFLLSTTASSIKVFFLTGNSTYLLQTLYVPCLLVSSQLVLAGFLNG